MLLDDFLDYVRERHLFAPEDKVLLAVSGGVDSMVMLDLFSRSGYRYGVAHCNFCLRGEEGDEDEKSVADVCAGLGAEHFNIRFDTLAEVNASGESVQMVARRLRYDWFERLCAEHGYTKIAIAHHADDSVETFFINLIRGTGLRGLTGIHVANGRIVRPLLFATRREILEYALNNGVAYREDSSNRSTKYLRNKIRLGVIPKIREVAPHFATVMTGNVERLSMALRFIDRQMELTREKVMTSEKDGVVLELDAIDPSLPENYVIYEMLRPYGFSPEVVHDLCRCIGDGGCGMKFHSVSHVAYLDRRRVIVRPVTPGKAYEIRIDRGVKKEFCLGGCLTFEELEKEDVEFLQQPENVALLDAGKLTYPLTVRSWREGDVFVPLGMEGHKKVSDYLIDAKVPLPDKERQLVVVSGDDIVWLVGRRIDHRYRVAEETRQVLRITKSESEETIII